jgi:hypothetical protein
VLGKRCCSDKTGLVPVLVLTRQISIVAVLRVARRRRGSVGQGRNPSGGVILSKEEHASAGESLVMHDKVGTVLSETVIQFQRSPRWDVSRDLTQLSKVLRLRHVHA